jgi:hypothetical protein
MGKEEKMTMLRRDDGIAPVVRNSFAILVALWRNHAKRVRGIRLRVMWRWGEDRQKSAH